MNRTSLIHDAEKGKALDSDDLAHPVLLETTAIRPLFA
jgi:hypothetical protein